MSRCTCSKTAYQFCNKSVDTFVNCKNINKILDAFPILDIIVCDFKHTSKKEYRIETDIILTNTDEKQLFCYLYKLIDFFENVSLYYRYIIMVAIFEAIFKAGRKLTTSPSLACQTYLKTCHFSQLSDEMHQAFNDNKIYAIVNGERVVPQNIFECFKQSLRVMIEEIPEETRMMYYVDL